MAMPLNFGLSTMAEDFAATGYATPQEPQHFTPGVAFEETFGGDALDSGFMAESLQDLFQSDLTQPLFGSSPALEMPASFAGYSFEPSAIEVPTYDWFSNNDIEPLSLPPPSWPGQDLPDDMASYLRGLDASIVEGSE